MTNKRKKLTARAHIQKALTDFGDKSLSAKYEDGDAAGEVVALICQSKNTVAQIRVTNGVFRANSPFGSSIVTRDALDAMTFALTATA